MKRIGVIARMVGLELLRRKDAYVLVILLGAMLVALLTMDVFGLGGTSRYVADIGLLMTWGFSFAIALPLLCRQLPSDEARGVVFAVLAKPIGRFEYVTGKWLGGWMGSLAATAAMYAVTWLVVASRQGHFVPVALVQAFLLHGMALAMTGALGIATSTRLSTGAAITVTAILLAVGLLVVPEVPRLAHAATDWRGDALILIYQAVPHMELFDMRQRLVHDWGPAPWGLVAVCILYGLAWTVFFLSLAWLGYRRRYFRRGLQ